jgi:hypothetical protein
MLPAGGFLTSCPPPANAAQPDASGGSKGNKVKPDMRKMANNLRIVGRIHGGHCVIIDRERSLERGVEGRPRSTTHFDD